MLIGKLIISLNFTSTEIVFNKSAMSCQALVTDQHSYFKWKSKKYIYKYIQYLNFIWTLQLIMNIEYCFILFFIQIFSPCCEILSLQ